MPKQRRMTAADRAWRDGAEEREAEWEAEQERRAALSPREAFLERCAYRQRSAVRDLEYKVKRGRELVHEKKWEIKVCEDYKAIFPLFKELNKLKELETLKHNKLLEAKKALFAKREAELESLPDGANKLIAKRVFYKNPDFAIEGDILRLPEYQDFIESYEARENLESQVREARGEFRDFNQYFGYSVKKWLKQLQPELEELEKELASNEALLAEAKEWDGVLPSKFWKKD